jgi:hypothetical protein
VPAATTTLEVHGPEAETEICFVSENPGTTPNQSVLDGSDRYALPPNVPLAVAVLVCGPAVNGIGPLTHVATGEMVGVPTGSVGNVEGRLSVCHTQVAGSPEVPASCGSLTENGLSVTSPTFSATKRK